MKLSSLFDRINNLDRNYSYWQIISHVCPLKYHVTAFISSILERVQRGRVSRIRRVFHTNDTHHPDWRKTPATEYLTHWVSLLVANWPSLSTYQRRARKQVRGLESADALQY